MYTHQVRISAGCTYTLPVTRRVLKEGESTVVDQKILDENRDIFDILKANPLQRVRVKPGCKHRSGRVLGNQTCYVTEAEIESFGDKFTLLGEGDEEVARVAVPDETGQSVVFDISAVALTLAEKHNIDLTQIDGSGASGRIVKKDVEAVIESGDA